MRGKKLLAAFLLGVGLCFVPGVGQGEIREALLMYEPRYIEVFLVQSTVRYIMFSHESFLVVMPSYDEFGLHADDYPAGVRTAGKIHIIIQDNRGIFYGKHGEDLLSQFKRELERFYLFMKHIATDMDADIVTTFKNTGGEELGYFYQGEYHLWSEEKAKEAPSIRDTSTKRQVVPSRSKRATQVYSGVGSGHWVSENIDGGRIIKLEDGSLWEISPIDRIDTMLWLPTEDITVVESDNPLYPYKLINTDAGDAVEAKLISD